MPKKDEVAKDETYSEEGLPKGTSQDPEVDPKPDLSETPDFQNFLNMAPSVAESDEETSSDEDNESAETSEEEAETEETVQETEATEEPSTEETPAETEVDDRDAQIEAQRLQLLEMSRVLEEQRAENNTQSVAKSIELEKIELSDEEYESAISSKDGLEALLNRVNSNTAKETYSKTLEALPGAVAPQIARANASQARANQFFVDNPELASCAGYVSFHMNQVNEQCKDMDSETRLAEVAKRCYQGMGIVKGQGKKARQKANRPANANTSGTRTTKPKMKAMEKDIIGIMSAR